MLTKEPCLGIWFFQPPFLYYVSYAMINYALWPNEKSYAMFLMICNLGI